jgi:hypothetical protein
MPLAGASPKRLGTRRGELNRRTGGPPFVLVIFVGVLLVAVSILIRSIFFSDVLVPSSSLLEAAAAVGNNGGGGAAAARKGTVTINKDTLLTTRPLKPVTVAYAISLIKVSSTESALCVCLFPVTFVSAARLTCPIFYRISYPL